MSRLRLALASINIRRACASTASGVSKPSASAAADSTSSGMVSQRKYDNRDAI